MNPTRQNQKTNYKIFQLFVKTNILDGPGRVGGGGEEVDAGQAGVPGQDRNHAACGAEPPRVHADTTGFVPQNGHHHLSRHRT